MGISCIPSSNLFYKGIIVTEHLHQAVSQEVFCLVDFVKINALIIIISIVFGEIID